MSALLEIKELHVTVAGNEILKGVNLTLPVGEVHAIMGPNGSGKSTLSYAIMGHPSYEVTAGDILLQGESLLELPTDERARRGLFLSFQYPTPIPGVTVSNFMRNVLKNLRGEELPVKQFRNELKDAMGSLQISPDLISRYVNDGFSGGEKKRNEILQMQLIKPRMIILDEIDSGLDIDAMKVIAATIEAQRANDRSLMIITHYQRLLSHLSVDRVHVFLEGRICKSGGPELAEQLEAEGYEWVDREISSQVAPK